MENLLEKIEELREKLLDLWRLLDIDRQIEQVNELKIEMSRSDFWDDREKAVAVGRQLEGLANETAKWLLLQKKIRDLEELVAVANQEADKSFADEALANYEDLKQVLDGFEFLVLFSGKYDRSNAIVSVHAGTGGTDAQDWAEMLERMFLRFSERKNFSTEILDFSAGNEAGIKSVTIKVSGIWAYGYLRGEAGVHRLVRISPFDGEGLRHTSFALVEVIPELPETIEVEILNEDLKVDTFRASGPGGQNVNKTESAIRITHLPSGIIVSCQTERSQHQNRENAMNILRAKLHQLQEAERQAETSVLRGETQKAEWGKQIRSYVMQPYQMVKDHRTNYETAQVGEVLDGKLEGFMEAYLRTNRG